MPSPTDGFLAGRSRGRWGFTRVASVGFTLLTVAVLVGSTALFVVQSLPVWRHSGLGFLTGREWYYRQFQFGALPMIYGTVAVAAVAMLLAVPLGIGAAVFTSEYLPRRHRLLLKLTIELLAGIPSVVYGLLGILVLRSYVNAGMTAIGFDSLSGGDSLLTAGILLGVMVLPTVMTLADDVLRGVPAAQRAAARGLGLTRTQTVLSVTLPQAYRGLVAACLLGLGRALGETIAVFLVVGRADNRLPSPWYSLRPLLDAGQTLTTKLGGSENNIAYGGSDPRHWAAIIGLGLMLLAIGAGVTLVGAWLQQDAAALPGRRVATANGIASRLASLMSPIFRPVAATWDAASNVLRPAVAMAVPIASGLCALTAVAVLAGIVGAILIRGLPAVTWHFLTEQIALVGASGGIFYNLVGTLILIAAAGVVTAPVAVGIAVTHGVYLRPGRARRALELLLYTLNGVPSILFGILGLVVFVKGLGWGKSWLAGGLLLGMMILPTVTVALIERIKVLPAKYVEAAVGLGLSKAQVVWSVVLPQSASGLLTGLLLGLARAAGETAPIMFTATIFAGATVPRGVVESPVLSLPYHIFILAQDSYDPAVPAKVWGSATVLLALVFLLSLIALPVRLRVHEEATAG